MKNSSNLKTILLIVGLISLLGSSVVCASGDPLEIESNGDVKFGHNAIIQGNLNVKGNLSGGGSNKIKISSDVEIKNDLLINGKLGSGSIVGKKGNEEKYYLKEGGYRNIGELIIQWGVGYNDTDDNADYKFPIKFSERPYSITANWIDSGSNGVKERTIRSYPIAILSAGESGFSINRDNRIEEAQKFYFMAIGR